MKQHVKYASARNQLYHLNLLWHRTLADAKVLHPTPQYRQAVEMATAVLQNACDAFERGNILEVLINEYVPTPLPGFEEFLKRARQAAKDDLPLTEDERAALEKATGEFLAEYGIADPFDGAGDWDLYDSPPPDADDGGGDPEERFLKDVAEGDDWPV